MLKSLENGKYVFTYENITYGQYTKDELILALPAIAKENKAIADALLPEITVLVNTENNFWRKELYLQALGGTSNGH